MEDQGASDLSTRSIRIKQAGEEIGYRILFFLGTSIAVGESVFTVGNAGGEGIVIRGGTLTPPTPERANGEWNDLRLWNLATGKLHGLFADG